MEAREITPGVLSGKQIQDLIDAGAISSLTGGDIQREVDASSLDLRIGRNIRQIGDALRPTIRELSQINARKETVAPHGNGDEEYFELERGQIYLIELDDFLDLPENVSGRATGKSSVGRLDIITRLITADGGEYDLVKAGYNGKLHLLVLPQTFSIRVAPGDSLNQLRLFCGPQHLSIIPKTLVPYYGTPFWYPYEGFEPGISSVADPTLFNLTVELSDRSEQYVFKARTDVVESLDLRASRRGEFPPEDYFERISVEYEEGHYVVLDRDSFYIMKSRERLFIPGDVAVEVVAISERLGDIRIHYAGFAHPGFGRSRGDAREGTPLIFEVRATDMPTKLSSGSVLARVQFFRMSNAVSIEGKVPSEYEEQELKLSSVFSDWSEGVEEEQGA